MIRIFGRQGQDPLTIVDFRFPPVDKNILHATRSNMCMLLSLRSKTRDGNWLHWSFLERVPQDKAFR